MIINVKIRNTKIVGALWKEAVFSGTKESTEEQIKKFENDGYEIKKISINKNADLPIIEQQYPKTLTNNNMKNITIKEAIQIKEIELEELKTNLAKTENALEILRQFESVNIKQKKETPIIKKNSPGAKKTSAVNNTDFPTIRGRQPWIRCTGCGEYGKLIKWTFENEHLHIGLCNKCSTNPDKEETYRQKILQLQK